MVGATRFELVTFCTPSKRATSLRYAPTGFMTMPSVYHGLPAASIAVAEAPATVRLSVFHVRTPSGGEDAEEALRGIGWQFDLYLRFPIVFGHQVFQ